MSVRKGGKVIAGNVSHYNIGDTFMTRRTDTNLAGAVECDGTTYNTTDFTGAQSIGNLLAAGKIDYISLTAYADAITQKGWCDKIGWDGTGNTLFRVPTINPRHYIIKTQKPTAENNYTWYKLYADGSVEQGGNATLPQQGANTFATATLQLPIAMQNSNYSIVENRVTDGGSSYELTQVGVNRTVADCGVMYFSTVATSGASVVNMVISGMSSITPQTNTRVMIQLFNSTTDEAVATVGGVLADVAGLKDMSNITATGKTNMLQYILGGLQTTDSSKVGYLQYYFEANNAVNAPAGGKWLVLDCLKVNTGNGVVYVFSADFTSPVGSIVAGGTQIAAARSGYTTRVLLLKVE